MTALSEEERQFLAQVASAPLLARCGNEHDRTGLERLAVKWLGVAAAVDHLVAVAAAAEASGMLAEQRAELYRLLDERNGGWQSIWRVATGQDLGEDHLSKALRPLVQTALARAPAELGRNGVVEEHLVYVLRDYHWLARFGHQSRFPEYYACGKLALAGLLPVEWVPRGMKDVVYWLC